MLREFARKPKRIKAVQVGELRKTTGLTSPWKDLPETLWIIANADGSERKMADDVFRQEYEPVPAADDVFRQEYEPVPAAAEASPAYVPIHRRGHDVRNGFG